MMIPLDIDHNEIERRKDLYRRFFDYQPVDHLPVFIWLQGATRPEHTIRWELESGQISWKPMPPGSRALCACFRMITFRWYASRKDT